MALSEIVSFKACSFLTTDFFSCPRFERANQRSINTSTPNTTIGRYAEAPER